MKDNKFQTISQRFRHLLEEYRAEIPHDLYVDLSLLLGSVESLSKHQDATSSRLKTKIKSLQLQIAELKKSLPETVIELFEQGEGLSSIEESTNFTKRQIKYIIHKDRQAKKENN